MLYGSTCSHWLPFIASFCSCDLPSVKFWAQILNVIWTVLITAPFCCCQDTCPEHSTSSFPDFIRHLVPGTQQSVWVSLPLSQIQFPVVPDLLVTPFVNCLHYSYILHDTFSALNSVLPYKTLLKQYNFCSDVCSICWWPSPLVAQGSVVGSFLKCVIHSGISTNQNVVCFPSDLCN